MIRVFIIDDHPLVLAYLFTNSTAIGSSFDPNQKTGLSAFKEG